MYRALTLADEVVDAVVIGAVFLDDQRAGVVGEDVVDAGALALGGEVDFVSLANPFEVEFLRADFVVSVAVVAEVDLVACAVGTRLVVVEGPQACEVVLLGLFGVAFRLLLGNLSGVLCVGGGIGRGCFAEFVASGNGDSGDGQSYHQCFFHNSYERVLWVIVSVQCKCR